MKSLLVVEDSTLIGNIVKVIFNRRGYNVTHTTDGREVSKIVKDHPINLVILDLMMPEISGKDVLMILKNNPETKKIPVIILTAKTNAIETDPELKICDHFMTKPFKNAELVSVVEKLLSKS